MWRLSPFHTTGYCHWRCLWSISGTYRILHIVEPHTNNQTLHYARIPAYLTWWIWILFFVKCVPKYSCLLHIYFTTTVLSSNSSPDHFILLQAVSFPLCWEAFLFRKSSSVSLRYTFFQPMFHDGMKEWSCCKQRSHDFSLFLQIPG